MTQPLATVVTNTGPDSSAFVATDRLGKPWRLSRNGYTFMAVLESGIANGTWNRKRVVDGFIVEVYDDGYGVPTVGFGHKVIPSDNLRIRDVISVERAREFFRDNLRPIEHAINHEVRVPLYQYEYDALVSVLFNSGPFERRSDDWFPDSRSKHLASFLNRGEYEKMGDVIRTFVATRVPWRRRLEARLFESGNYDARH